MADTRERRYPGVYAAMPTPLTAERAVDRAGIRRVVDYLLGSGIDGLSILGSTGECAALSQRQRREALEAVLDAAAGRGTIFTGAAGTVVEDVLADLEAAEGTGVAGALVPPPFYFRLDTRGVVDFYQRLAEASPVPILLYHIPQMTKVPIPLEAVARLAEHPNVIGIKDSSGDFDNFTALARLARDLPGFTVLTGSDSQLAAALLVGGHGIIGAGVNIVPDVAAALYRAWQEGDLARAVDLQQRIVDAVAACHIGVFPAAYKAMLALKGLADPYPARPIPPLDEAETAELRARLARIGALGPARAAEPAPGE